MKKKLIWMIAAILTCGTMSAQTQQAVNTGNGKAVQRITFDREQVNIIYADGTTDKGVQQATIRRESTTTGLRSINNASSTIGHSTYDLQGRKISNGPISKGIYIKREGNKIRKTVKK